MYAQALSTPLGWDGVDGGPFSFLCLIVANFRHALSVKHLSSCSELSLENRDRLILTICRLK
jgi:hypothetical protein